MGCVRFSVASDAQHAQLGRRCRVRTRSSPRTSSCRRPAFRPAAARVASASSSSRRGARGAHGREDAAARGGDLRVVAPAEPASQLVAPVAGEDDVRVRVDESGHERAPAAIDDDRSAASIGTAARTSAVVPAARIVRAVARDRAVRDRRDVALVAPGARSGPGDRVELVEMLNQQHGEDPVSVSEPARDLPRVRQTGNLDRLVSRRGAGRRSGRRASRYIERVGEHGDDGFVGRAIDRRRSDADEQTRPSRTPSMRRARRTRDNSNRRRDPTPQAPQSQDGSPGCCAARRSPCRRGPSSRLLRSPLRSPGSCPSTARCSRSAGMPPATSASRSSRSRRNHGRESSATIGNRRDDHQSRELDARAARRARRSTMSATAAASAPCLVASRGEVDLNQHARPRAGFARRPRRSSCSSSSAIDRLDPARTPRRPCLRFVRLQVADEVPLEAEVGERLDLRRGLPGRGSRRSARWPAVAAARTSSAPKVLETATRRDSSAGTRRARCAAAVDAAAHGVEMCCVHIVRVRAALLLDGREQGLGGCRRSSRSAPASRIPASGAFASAILPGAVERQAEHVLRVGHLRIEP